MTHTWHSLATAGAPPTIVALDIKHRKLYSQPPTADGAAAAAAVPVGPTPQPPSQPQRLSLDDMLPRLNGLPLQALGLPPAFTFPGAAEILNRASADHDKENQAHDDDDDENEDEDDGEYQYEKLCALAAKTDCDAMRRKIQRFLARKTMTQTAFLRKIECNSNSYRMFMSYKGKHKGINNQVYDGALLFFDKLEKEEGKSVTSKRASKPKGAAASETTATATTMATAKLSRKDQQAQTQELLDKIHATQLQEPVYVFDDCDDIRKKINETIESKTLTQAALLRAMDVNSNSLRRFLTTKGKREGCSNGVYYSAFCFFEKWRLVNGVAKTSKRLKNEREMPTGYSLKRDPTHTWVFVGAAGRN